MPLEVIKSKYVAENIVGIRPKLSGSVLDGFYVCSYTDPGKLILFGTDLVVKKSATIGKKPFDLEVYGNKILLACKDKLYVVDSESFSVLNSVTPPTPSGTSSKWSLGVKSLGNGKFFVTYGYRGSYGYKTGFFIYTLQGNELSLDKERYVSDKTASNGNRVYNGYIYCAGKGVVRKLDFNLNIVKEAHVGDGWLTDDISVSNGKIYVFDMQYDKMIVLDENLNVLKSEKIYERTHDIGQPIEGYGNHEIDGYVIVSTPGDEVVIVDTSDDSIVERIRISGLYKADEVFCYGDKVLLANWNGTCFYCKFTEPSPAVLNISSTPSGAKVYVDGVYKGVT